MNLSPLLRKALAEFLGVTMFLTAIVGGFHNSSNNPLGVASLATTLGLAILVTGPISGGHLNPAVSIYFYSRREISVVELLSYIGSQILGAIFGVFIASQMFGDQFTFATTNSFASWGALLSEVFVTGGLVWLVGRLATTGKGNLIPAAVGLWVFAAAIFSSSGAQANPAVSIGFFFIGQGSAQTAGFILAQLLGMLIAAVFVFLFADKKKFVVKAADEVANKPAAPAAPKAPKKPATPKTPKKPATPKTPKKPAAK